jgi:hypothetical protein
MPDDFAGSTKALFVKYAHATTAMWMDHVEVLRIITTEGTIFEKTLPITGGSLIQNQHSRQRSRDYDAANTVDNRVDNIGSIFRGVPKAA